MVNSGNAVKSPDGKDHVVNDFDGEVAARVVHVGYWSPGVGRRVVHLPAAHPRYAVEATDHVDLQKILMRQVKFKKNWKSISNTQITLFLLHG